MPRRAIFTLLLAVVMVLSAAPAQPEASRATVPAAAGAQSFSVDQDAAPPFGPVRPGSH
jgi:hypothetical protein